jgi:hypothetical protein
MNWKLIFSLSLFGLAMAVATVYWIPNNAEWIFWLLIFIFCAWRIALKAPGKYFLHGFLTSLVNCVWITSAHIILVHIYAANHAREMESMVNMPMGNHTRMWMAIFGPVAGIISGLVLGLFAFIASKIMKKPAKV